MEFEKKQNLMADIIDAMKFIIVEKGYPEREVWEMRLAMEMPRIMKFASVMDAELRKEYISYEVGRIHSVFKKPSPYERELTSEENHCWNAIKLRRKYIGSVKWKNVAKKGT